ncbi:MAG: polymer-forming cytoskeletal protein [Acidimicrobiia bacterium]
MAAELANSEFVIVQTDDVVEGDLYAGAIKVLVEGQIDGDLVASAAEEIVIDGVVTGSVFAAAPRVTINGEIGGSLRATANDLRVDGTVGRDLVSASVDARLGPSSSVVGDVILWTFRSESLGRIGGDLSGSQRILMLGGEIEGDIDVSSRRVTVVQSLQVGGDFDYRSDRMAEGLDKATVEGVVVHKTPLPPNIRVRALGFFGRFLVILFLTIAALGSAWAWPARAAAATSAVKASPLRAWGRGAMVTFSPLFLALIAWMVVGLAPPAASFPMLAILAPLVIAAFGAILVSSLFSGMPAVAWLGSKLSKRLDLYGAIVLGSAIAGAIWLVPLVGWLVPLIILPLGMGGWMGAWRDSTAHDRAVERTQIES